jgi:hypothetical protein
MLKNGRAKNGTSARGEDPFFEAAISETSSKMADGIFHHGGAQFGATANSRANQPGSTRLANRRLRHSRTGTGENSACAGASSAEAGKTLRVCTIRVTNTTDGGQPDNFARPGRACARVAKARAAVGKRRSFQGARCPAWPAAGGPVPRRRAPFLSRAQKGGPRELTQATQGSAANQRMGPRQLRLQCKERACGEPGLRSRLSKSVLLQKPACPQYA